jgi:diguanylate cyclase (GGDEF)-like protein
MMNFSPAERLDEHIPRMRRVGDKVALHMVTSGPISVAQEADEHSLDTEPSHTALSLDSTGLPDVRQRVLIIDDVDANRSALAELLDAEHDVSVASGGEEGLALARKLQPDVILLDVVMPGMNGYDVLDHLKAEPRTASISVIFITGLDRPEDEAHSLQRGGSDFISKPFNPDVVSARVALHLRLSRHQRQLQRIANLDGLTGIANRRQFDRTLAAELRRARRAGHTLSVAMVDVDYFKQYNDRYGHAMGDKALLAVAQVLQSGLRRPGDLAARYGGEEFGLVISESESRDVVAFADLFCAKVRALGIAHESSLAVPWLTVSIGVSSLVVGSEMAPHALVDLADRRLYEAKAQGRNRVVGGSLA